LALIDRKYLRIANATALIISQTGYTPSNKTFFGTIYSGSPSFYGYFKVIVNGIDEYLKIYTSSAGTGCCSCINGTLDTVGSYEMKKHGYINCDGLHKWVALYE